MKIIKLAIISFFLFIFSCSVTKQESSPICISSEELINNPNKYDGKIISIIGFNKTEYLPYYLYSNCEDESRFLVLKKNKWVDKKIDIRKGRNCEKVKLTGIFKKEDMFSIVGRLYVTEPVEYID